MEPSNDIEVFAKHKTSYRLVFLTSNKEPAEDALTLNKSKAIKGYTIVSRKLNLTISLIEYN